MSKKIRTEVDERYAIRDYSIYEFDLSGISRGFIWKPVWSGGDDGMFGRVSFCLVVGKSDCGH